MSYLEHDHFCEICQEWWGCNMPGCFSFKNSPCSLCLNDLERENLEYDYELGMD